MPTAPGSQAWLVQPGHCFWTIAARSLPAQLGRPVSEGEVYRYWRRLIAANADRLAIPGYPDLIFPGQVFVLPPAVAW
jgi:nucleoid-associated protein YgaU